MVNVKTVFTVLLMVSSLALRPAAATTGTRAGQPHPLRKRNVETTSRTAARESHKPVLIKTHLALVNAEGETTGEVLSGSTLGDSPFCAGGSFADAAWGAPGRVGGEERSAAPMAP